MQCARSTFFCRMQLPYNTLTTLFTLSPIGIVRLTVEWFMSRESNRWLGWKRIIQKHTYFRWKIKWRLEHLGALGIMGETAPLQFSRFVELSLESDPSDFSLQNLSCLFKKGWANVVGSKRIWGLQRISADSLFLFTSGNVISSEFLEIIIKKKETKKKRKKERKKAPNHPEE